MKQVGQGGHWDAMRKSSDDDRPDGDNAYLDDAKSALPSESQPNFSGTNTKSVKRSMYRPTLSGPLYSTTAAKFECTSTTCSSIHQDRFQLQCLQRIAYIE